MKPILPPPRPLRRVSGLSLVAGALVLITQMPAEAACPTGPVKRSREPLEITVELKYTTQPNSDPTACTVHGPATIRVKSGSAVASTFAFADGEVVIIDWNKKTVEGKYTTGVVVDFKKGQASFEKTLSRLELVSKSFSSGPRTRVFEREQLFEGVQEDGITFIPD